MQRLRGRVTSLLKGKAVNSWAAVHDTFVSTKDIFERHRVVFTLGTSMASVATAWAGYCIRHYHESKVDQRLESIEQVMKSNYEIEHAEFKKLVNPGNSSIAASIATAGTTFIIGYGLGWRGGRWHANRKLKQQMKKSGQKQSKRWLSLGRIKPRQWQFELLRRLTKIQNLSVGKASKRC
ncbi:hypothetical protein K2173_018881 [Erythroxylum novogranatense]|uniref:Uncharacterized protein n=1 Tax=Erythroxylum novogranatense TaxID=1862640 RepID=A0AAV8SBH2_9ROSI|nr:hypothetical protein K2173_018881 [Erythroxylum novogranatense]